MTRDEGEATARLDAGSCRGAGADADGVRRTVVHLLRHGEVHNPGGILYGRLPGFRLSPLGEQMAEAAARALADHDVTYVVSSPLERAQQTAAPIAAAHQLPVATDERLIEAVNAFEGKHFGVGDGVLRRPGTWVKLRDPFTPSWGEPYREIAQRLCGALLAARDAARGHEAVCVSHQSPIWLVRRYLENKPLWHHPGRRQCGLASLTSFTYDGERLASIGYSEPAAHLVSAAVAAKPAGA